MSDQSQEPQVWIGLECDVSEMRAWTFGEVASSTPVGSQADAQALAPGAPILRVGTPSGASLKVPAKPADLLPETATEPTAGPLVWQLPDLVQSAPGGHLGAHALRIDAFLSLNPNWDGVICLPGQTSIWALVSADEVVSFQPFATSQLLNALCPNNSTPETPAMGEVLQDVMSRPERMAAKLAEAQSHLQLGHLSQDEAAGWIWGACLGAELAAARPYWLGQNLALIAPAPFAAPYRAALESQGLPVTVADEARLTQLGFERAWARRAG